MENIGANNTVVTLHQTSNQLTVKVIPDLENLVAVGQGSSRKRQDHICPIFGSLSGNLLRRDPRFATSTGWGLELGAGRVISPGFRASVGGNFGGEQES
jgi:hypothetical protein